MTDYQKYLKTLSDRDVSDLWVRYCAPRERTRELTDLELSRAYDIHYENEEREEEKWRERGCYPAQGDYPDPLD